MMEYRIRRNQDLQWEVQEGYYNKPKLETSWTTTHIMSTHDTHDDALDGLLKAIRQAVYSSEI